MSYPLKAKWERLIDPSSAEEFSTRKDLYKEPN
jgi:hypothetical protein